MSRPGCCVDVLTCPVCSLPLNPHGAGAELAASHTKVEITLHDHPSMLCDNGHTFDIAREGYVNLLLRKPLGDTREMLQARRGFLDQGYYARLSQTINACVDQHLAERFEDRSPDAGPHILDVGCGEGYYLGSLQRDRDAQPKAMPGCYLGLDISKEAIRMAAKRYTDGGFVVADVNRRLVIADRAQYVLLNIFAPRNAPEFARVVAPGGMLLVVIPGPGHLSQLRALLGLLDIEQDKQAHVQQQFAPWFTLVKAHTLDYELSLAGADLVNCVKMTPNYWHLDAQKRAALECMQGGVETEAQFVCLQFIRD